MAIAGIQGIIFDLDDTLNYSFKHPELEGTPLPGIVDLLTELKERYMIAGASNQAGSLYKPFQDAIIALKNTYSQTWTPKPYPTAQETAEKLGNTWDLLDLTATSMLHVAVYDEQVEKLLTPPGQLLDDMQRAKILEAAEVIAGKMGDILIDRGIAAQVHWEPEYRKPKPQMLLTIASQWGIPPAAIAYCGDMYTFPRDSDLAAARAAGMQFVEAEEITSLL